MRGWLSWRRSHGCSEDRDVEQFTRVREVVLKHGRIAIFTSIGYIAPECYKLPGFLSGAQEPVGF